MVLLQRSNPGMVILESPAPMVVFKTLMRIITILLLLLFAFNSQATDYYVKKYLDQLFAKDAEIDSLLLGCTHYPLLLEKIKEYLPENINIIEQGPLVAQSLQQYLLNHPKIEETICKNEQCVFYTTGDPEQFNHRAARFFGKEVRSKCDK